MADFTSDFPVPYAFSLCLLARLQEDRTAGRDFPTTSAGCFSRFFTADCLSNQFGISHFTRQLSRTAAIIETDSWSLSFKDSLSGNRSLSLPSSFFNRRSTGRASIRTARAGSNSNKNSKTPLLDRSCSFRPRGCNESICNPHPCGYCLKSKTVAPNSDCAPLPNGMYQPCMLQVGSRHVAW